MDHWRLIEDGNTYGAWATRGAAVKRARDLRREGKRVALVHVIDGRDMETIAADADLPILSDDEL